MTDWAIVVVVVGSVLLLIGLGCGIVMGTEQAWGWMTGWLTLAVVCGLAITACALWWTKPFVPSPKRGYVLGLEIDPAHVEEECYLVGKVTVCDDVFYGTRYAVKLEALDGHIGWRDVTARVFADCQINDLYDRDLCSQDETR